MNLIFRRARLYVRMSHADRAYAYKRLVVQLHQLTDATPDQIRAAQKRLYNLLKLNKPDAVPAKRSRSKRKEVGV